MKRLVIFDLDGTLLNTIADLSAATNYALQTCGFPVHDIDSYRYFVGNGITKLIERSLPEANRSKADIEKIRSLFISYYNEHNVDLSVPYPGIEHLLGKLQAEHVLLAVASNKYQEATSKLVKHYFPGIAFASVLGQRDGVPTKPDPRIVNEIIGTCNLTRKDTVYVGDSNVDMQTGKNAQVTTIGVSWGFRSCVELQAYHPDCIADKPCDILNFLGITD